jgi:hypothetical protein
MRDARQDKAMHPAPRARLLAGLAALAALAALAILAVVTVLPPSPRTDTGTTGEFVAARAFHDVLALVSTTAPSIQANHTSPWQLLSLPSERSGDT